MIKILFFKIKKILHPIFLKFNNRLSVKIWRRLLNKGEDRFLMKYFCVFGLHLPLVPIEVTDFDGLYLKNYFEFFEVVKSVWKLR